MHTFHVVGLEEGLRQVLQAPIQAPLLENIPSATKTSHCALHVVFSGGFEETIEVNPTKNSRLIVANKIDFFIENCFVNRL